MTEHAVPPQISASRRAFLGRSAVATAGLVTAYGAGGETAVQAAAPVQRHSGSHMKLSLAGYSFNRYLPKAWTPEQLADAKMTLSDFIEYCASLDLDGTELTGYYFPKKITPAYLMQLKQQTFRSGLDISGTAIGNDFGVVDGDEAKRELADVRAWIDHAALLGAPVIRIFAGRVPKGETEQATIERCIRRIDTSLEYAAQKGVFLALENHGGITATSDQMLRIIKGVGDSPWFGVNFDSGNFRTAKPYADLERIAPFAVNAQIKLAMMFEGKKEEANLERVIGILKSAGYRGYVVLEYEEREEPKEAIPAAIARLRELIG